MYVEGTTTSTKVLNPDAGWREAIVGEFKPVLNLYEVPAELLAILYEGLKNSVKKAESFEALAKFADYGKKLEDAFREAQEKAVEDNKAARIKYDAWQTAQEAENGAEAAEG